MLGLAVTVALAGGLLHLWLPEATTLPQALRMLFS